MTPGKLDTPLEPVTTGDTWPGFTITGVTGNGFGDLTRVRMHLRQSSGSGELLLDSDDVEGSVQAIAITDAANWAFAIGPVHYDNFTLPSGTYNWDIETTDENDVRRTILAGELEVGSEVTRV